MQRLFYLDTSIWVDIYDKKRRHNAEACLFMEMIIKCDDIVLFSDLVMRELKGIGLLKEQISRLLRSPKPTKLWHVHIYSEDTKGARELSRKRGVPKGDALHAILARNNYSQLISRDKDFEKLRDITEAKRPEDII